MAPHSSTLAWKIPWMKEPGGLQSMGSQPATSLKGSAQRQTEDPHKAGGPGNQPDQGPTKPTRPPT